MGIKFAAEDYRVEVSNPTAAGPTAPKGTHIASFAANAIGIEATSFDSRTITFSVAESALPDGAGMSDVALFVRTSSGWERVSISGDTGTFTATTDSFSTFAVTVLSESPSTNTPEGTANATNTPEGTDTASNTVTDDVTETSSSQSPIDTDDVTETTTPGFGVLNLLVALAAGLLAVRRWRG